MKYEGLMSGRWDLCSTNVIRGGKREFNIGCEEVYDGIRCFVQYMERYGCLYESSVERF